MIEQYYGELLKQESIYLQKYQNGYHTKRIKCESMQELQQIHLKGYNHRKLGINEIVWDIDCHESTLSHQLWQRISTNLQNDNISHSVWNTSRSFHIHALFERLQKYCQENRKHIKLLILKHYAKDDMVWCDKNMANENHCIRDFNSIHEQTGKPKIQIYWFIGKSISNPIKPLILSDFRKKVSLYLNLPKSLNLGSNEALEPKQAEALTLFLEFAQNTPFPKSGMGKNNLYFKNIAIAVYNLGYDNKTANQIFKNIAMQCKPHGAENMMTWLKWCKQQKHEIKVNWKEVKNFYGNS